jgi:glutamine synthetase
MANGGAVRSSQGCAVAIVLADLVDRELPWRHDPRRLAEALLSLYARRGGDACAGEGRGVAG